MSKDNRQVELEDYIGGKRSDDRLDFRGREIPDPTPIAPPIGYKRQPSLAEQIRAMVRSERLAQEAEQAGFETFEEADDFNVGDDFDPHSPYENDFDPPVSELRRRSEAEEAAVAASSEPAPTPLSQGAKPASGGAKAPLTAPEVS